jgi:hypothetical protein
MKKDTIYVDADDEISTVADSVANSKAKVVALVLPKRCNMLHSAVNMKILNKASKNAGKQIVLITTEQALMPIAGASAVYVAKSLNSKPFLPAVQLAKNDEQEVSASMDEAEPDIDPKKSIGELAGDEPIVINEADEEAPVKNTKGKDKKDKKLKVPNFESFRVKLFIALAVIVLLAIFVYVANFVLPKASITIVSKRQEIPVAVNITASEGFNANDIDQKSFKLETKSIDKAESKSADTTGTKNIGQTASGTLTITNCESSTSITIPKGTVVTASGPSGYRFTTDEAVKVPGSNFSGGGRNCDESGDADVKITAQAVGGAYNISARSYKLDSSFGNVTAYGGNMSGGTDETVKIVAQDDCDALKANLIANSNSDTYKQQLIAEFEKEGLSASLDSYKAETVSSTCEPAVGQPAEKVTAKATFKYTLSGVSSDSLAELITKEAQNIAGDDQTIIDTGLSKAQISVESRSGNKVQLSVKTTAITGIKQDEAKIKELIAGKNARQTSDSLKAIKGVNEVKINYSPFWVKKTPKDINKVTIIFENQ